jgi:hypothetical protein
MAYGNSGKSWISLTAQWSSEPVLHDEPVGGEIYLYTYAFGILYRYISDDGLTDAFYTDDLLTDLVSDRNYL